MKIKTCEFTLAGEHMLGAKDEQGNYYLAVTEIDSCFGDTKEHRFTLRKLGQERVKLALGATLHTPQKLRVGRSHRSFIRVETFVELLDYMAFVENSTMARALFKACAKEAVDRRIDTQLGVTLTEEEREEQTRIFFRELARKSFHPQLTSAMKGSFPNNKWGVEVNRFKAVMGLPADCVDTYGEQELQLWCDGMSRYNCLREQGKTHAQTLIELHRQMLDKSMKAS